MPDSFIADLAQVEEAQGRGVGADADLPLAQGDGAEAVDRVTSWPTVDLRACPTRGGTVHFLLLVGALLVGAVAAIFLAVRAPLVVRKDRVRQQRGWRRAGFLVGSGALVLYMWGLLHLLGAVMQAEDGGAGSSPLGPCREAGEQIAGQVIGYDVSYLWLRFNCRLSDGGTYNTSTVPGYVNPAVGLLGVTAFVLVALPGRRRSGASAG